MNLFFDTSALVKLFSTEAGSEQVKKLLQTQITKSGFQNLLLLRYFVPFTAKQEATKYLTLMLIRFYMLSKNNSKLL